ncbi:MAG: ATP-binding protein, partial [Candidatus Electrothrix sp. AUS1_2]|nr:ATP-binding protein [Candidatus Electrothrix sp. AUS1_2]
VWVGVKRAVVDAVRQIQGKKSRYPGCMITVDIEENLDCWGDRQQIQIVFVHLLENSCFASKDCGEPIRVQIRDEPEEQSSLCVAVIDKGTGFPDDIRDKVFLPFFSTREDSAGLGLAIVRQFVEQHGGTVTLSLPEEGSIVEVRLPLPAAPTAEHDEK